MRIYLARLLLRLGDFIKSLPVVVMRPDDLVEFSRQTYAESERVVTWTEQPFVDSGLVESELALLATLPTKKGELLLLGVGGGREAIPLTKLGFSVTGVDFVPAMVELAIENADRHGINIKGMVQEISQLDLPSDTYDVVWLFRSMYSCVPTRVRRVEMVRRISQALKPGGYFLCQFHWDPLQQSSGLGMFLRRLIAYATLGNLMYEEGDILWRNIEFIHAFSSEDAIRTELEEGGFSVLRIQTGRSHLTGEAVCLKCPVTSKNP